MNLYYHIVSHSDQPVDRTFQKLRRYKRRFGGFSYNRDRLPRVDKCRLCAYLYEKNCRQRDVCN